MGHSGSSGILLILVSIVVPEEQEEEKHEFLGVFDVFLK